MEQSDLRGLRPFGWVVGKKAAVNFRTRPQRSRSGVRYIVNVIGTKDSILADFARNKGKDENKWRDPFERDPFFDGDALSRWRCRDLNLQVPFKLVIGALAESDITKLVRECAENFGLAYNHQSAPRCFAFETDDFPWRQYRARD